MEIYSGKSNVHIYLLRLPNLVHIYTFSVRSIFKSLKIKETVLELFNVDQPSVACLYSSLAYLSAPPLGIFHL